MSKLGIFRAPFGSGPRPPKAPRAGGIESKGPGWIQRGIAAMLALAVAYGVYFWEYRRVVVPFGHVMVLIKKDGSRSLPGDQVIIPRMPDAADVENVRQWHQQYDDCNGILEAVLPEGTYFGYSPFDYEREIFDLKDPKVNAIVPQDKVGIVIKKFGKPLDVNTEGQVTQVLADPGRDQLGPLPEPLRPGRYNAYANPYAYRIILVDPVTIGPGYRGVVTNMAARPAREPDEYLVEVGEQGVQRQTEPAAIRYINPFQQRIKAISILSQRFEMSGADSSVVRARGNHRVDAAVERHRADSIVFPSRDSFDISLDGFVEWSINPDQLPLIYVQYANGGELIQYLEERVILPYARSFCRLVGSQYDARDFISGDTKLKFQADFEAMLREACAKEGIDIKQALVRNIVPPPAIKNLINEREIAREQILQYQQQITVAASMAKLATQQETAIQNQTIGDANKAVVKVTKAAEQERDVALTMAQQQLSVAKLQLEAAQKEADAQIAKGRAEADVILLKTQAEAEPLQRQIQAFGDGDAYARFFFYQKIAPSMKSILTTTDGPLADVFKQFAQPVKGVTPVENTPPVESTPRKVTDAQR